MKKRLNQALFGWYCQQLLAIVGILATWAGATLAIEQLPSRRVGRGYRSTCVSSPNHRPGMGTPTTAS